MTIPANLYADKVYAEQPTALWSLDDTVNGVSPISITSKAIAVSQSYGIEAASYGADIFPGYYLTANASAGSSYVSDTGIPMVYGASNITNVYKNASGPSIIFPAFGFLNNIGKNQVCTFEFWAKINSTSSIPRRIFGPIASTDGLYVHGPFITMKVGKYSGSYFVGEWGKPTLIDMVYEPIQISLLINGEQVINLSIDKNEITFPNKMSSDVSPKDQDWVGIYAYDDVNPVSLDCVAIYPYKVSSFIAKRRWVYGQAVQPPEIENFSNNDIPIIMDYQFAKYGKNYIYPDLGKWIQGSFDNLNFDNDRLEAPKYVLPNVVLESIDSIEEWYGKQSIGSGTVDTLESNDLYFKMIVDDVDSPNTADSALQSYISFGKMGEIINDPIYSLYIVAESGNNAPTGNIASVSESIFKIQHTNGSYIEATIQNSNATSAQYLLSYVYSDIDGSNTTISTSNVAFNSSFVAGISIPKLISSLSQASYFFSDPQNLSLFFCGKQTLEETFSGKTFRIGFSNTNNYKKISTKFETDGTVDETLVTDFLEHYATYTLIPTNFYGEFKLDIATNSFWKDYVPLAYFAKNVLDENLNEYQDLDFLHFMVDYPEPQKYITHTNLVDYEVDTSKSLIKTYVYFSNVPENENQAIFQDTLTNVSLKYGKTVSPESGAWSDKKYEVVNDSLVYPPQDTDFKNLFINFFVEVFNYGILNNPVSIRSLRIGSRSLNKTIENEVGTKLGKNLYPYSIIDNQKNYKFKNPISVYTGSTPYLYLTKYSGTRLLGNSYDGSRGFEIRLNESSFDYFKISSLQFAMMSDDIFHNSDTEIARIIKNNSSNFYKIYAKRSSSDATKQTATLYAVSVNPNTLVETVLDNTSVIFYINGKSSTLPQPTDLPIKTNEWDMISIKFVNPIVLSGETSGLVQFTGPFRINNINTYRISAREEGDRVFYNNWQNILDMDSTWNVVDDSYWSNVAVSVQSVILGRNPLQIYNVYVGNNRLVVDASLLPLETNSYQYNVYKDMKWETASVKVV